MSVAEPHGATRRTFDARALCRGRRDSGGRILHRPSHRGLGVRHPLRPLTRRTAPTSRGIGNVIRLYIAQYVPSSNLVSAVTS